MVATLFLAGCSNKTEKIVNSTIIKHSDGTQTWFEYKDDYFLGHNDSGIEYKIKYTESNIIITTETELKYVVAEKTEEEGMWHETINGSNEMYARKDNQKIDAANKKRIYEIKDGLKKALSN